MTIYVIRSTLLAIRYFGKMDFINQSVDEKYKRIRSGTCGFYEQKRGLIAVWGKEAVQFLDGMITNNVKKLADGAQLLAASPNAQGRLLAVVRVLRQGDKFLIETEEATREKVFQNLFRFTFAGDFFVEDLSDGFKYFDLFGELKSSPPYARSEVAAFRGRGGSLAILIPCDCADKYVEDLRSSGAVEISDDLYETLRIENGIPKFGVDMDETTIVPELGLEDLISYDKGCYIGQEIIARIHFRGHVAKQLTGLILSEPAVAGGLTSELKNAELKSLDGKNAGRITSSAFSPKIGKIIALAYVRYEYLQEGTKLKVGEMEAEVKNLPFLTV